MEAEKKRILFVDDDDRILHGLQRMLRPMRNEWEMTFVDSADAALELMDQTSFDILVSDMRMPGKDGAALLSEVSTRHPHTIRFILSGHSDMEMSLRTADTAHQFLAKPCDAGTIRNSVARAFALRDIIANNELRGIVAQIRRLPALPAIYSELVNELQSPDSSMNRAGAIIEKDVAISAKILQLVNSAFFGLCRRVSSPAQAASLLGLEIIKALILGTYVFREANGIVGQTDFLDALWQHSIGTGRCAQEIVLAELKDRHIAEQAFMAGMLHDLGKLIVVSRLPVKHDEITALATGKPKRWIDAEKQALSTTHAEIGAYLLGIWGFPDEIVEAVAFHHNPGNCLAKDFSILTAVHAGNAMEREISERTPDFLFDGIDKEYIEQTAQCGKWDIWRARCKKEYETA